MGYITLNTLKNPTENDLEKEAEKVFSGRSGDALKFISYLARVMVAKQIRPDAPCLEAWEAEKALVSTLAGLSDGDLKSLVKEYLRTHWLHYQCGRPWLKDAPMFYLERKVGRWIVTAMTCNEIQRHIVHALWEETVPGTTEVTNL